MKLIYYKTAPYFLAVVFLCITHQVLSLEHPSGWLADKYLELARYDTEIQDSSYSLSVELTNGDSYRSLRGQEIPVTAGQSFNYSFYYNSSAHVRIRGILEWVGATATYATSWGGDGIDNAAYEQFVLSGTVPAGATGLRVRIEFDAQSGFNLAGEIQYIDNVRYEEPVGTIREIYNGSFERWQKVNWTEIIRRSASDGASNNGYGWSVSIYGNYAAVGVPNEECVYLLKKDQGGTENWGEFKILTASDGSNGDKFGQSVSLSSQFLVVGAPGHRYDVNGANSLQLAGAVYVFRSSEGGSDNWGEYKKFVPGDRQEQDQFGTSVSIWGQTFIVGCPLCDLDEDGLNFLAWAGAAYIFETPYSYVRKKLVAGDRQHNDNFGWSVSIIGNDAAVGAIQHDYDTAGLNLLSNAGAAYVYNKDQDGSNQWGEVKKIVASDRHEDQMFGNSVSINGSALLVGAPRNDFDINGVDSLNQSGACYLYGENQDGEDNWGEMMKIVPPDRHEGDNFGNSVSIGYTDFIAAARYNGYDALGDNYLQGAGSAYQFSQKVPYMDTWELANKVVSGNRTSFTSFGRAADMNISGGYSIVGNPGNVDSKGGVVSIFKPVIQAAYIEFSNVTANSFSIFFARGEGENRAVFVKEGNTGTVLPQHNDTYSASSEFGSGEQVASSGWYCVYNGTGHKATITGLDPDTEYRVMVCEYNGAAGSEKYFTCAAVGNPTNISTGMDLSGVNVNIAIGLITGTTLEMQYSLNSTDGADGDWYDCSDGITSVVFQEGPVYVREKDLTSNTSLVINIDPAPAAPTFSINYQTEKTNEIVTSSIEYNFDNDFSTTNSAGPDNYLNVTPGMDLYLRTKATTVTLPGAVQFLDVPLRAGAPSYSVNYLNETTAENGDTEHEYSVQSNMTGAISATGIPIPLSPGTDIYIRSKYTSDSFSGEIQHLIVPARPVIDYTLDFTTETTSENVSTEDEYSLQPDMSQAFDGSGLRIPVTPGENLYFRRKATNSSFTSEVQTLVVPERPEIPVVSLSDKNSSSALFKKSADGTGEQVGVQDAMEYSENFGINWNPVTPVVTVDASGMKHITVRKMSTIISFASAPTENLDYEKPSVSVITDETCNGSANYVICLSNLDNGVVYLIAEGEPQSGIGDFNSAIDAGKGSMAAVNTPNADIHIPAAALIPGTYYAYATNDWDSLSDAGATAINIYGIPVIDLGADIIKCEDTEVIIGPGTEYPSYLWNYNNATTQSIVVTEEDDYILTVTDENGCQNSDTVSIRYNIPYAEEKICIITISMTSGKNIIVWEKTPDQGIASYNIYREGTHIGTKLYDELSIFIDTVADPEARPYLYYLSVIDSCGNESELSPYHKPFFLQYVGSVGGVNLEWDEYEIEGETVDFDSYTIYRGSDSAALSPFAENIPIVINVYKDTDPFALERKYYYRIAGELITPCYPSEDEKAGIGPYNHSLSNLDDNRLRETFVDGILAKEGIMIYPNPMSSRTTIHFQNPSMDKYQLSVIDLSGKIVYYQDNIFNDRFELSRGELSPGLYIVELKGPKIYRGKIVIE